MHSNTVIPKIFTLLIFARLIFTVIYYSWFQKAVKVCCCKSLLQLNFQVFIIVISFNCQWLTTAEISGITISLHTRSVKYSVNRQWSIVYCLIKCSFYSAVPTKWNWSFTTPLHALTHVCPDNYKSYHRWLVLSRTPCATVTNIFLHH